MIGVEDMPTVVTDMPFPDRRTGKLGRLVKKNHDAGKNDEYNTLVVRGHIAKMYLKGMTQVEIAAEIGCSQPTVGHHLRKIREEWLNSIIRDFDAAKAQELARIDHLEQVAWEAFDRSCENAITKHKDVEQELKQPKGADGKPIGEPVLTTTGVTKKRTSRGQSGDPRFLERIAWCIDYRCKLLGILKDAPTSNNTLILNFDQFYGKPEIDDPIERKIREVQAQSVSSSQDKEGE